MRNPFKYGMRVGGNEFFDRAKTMRDIRNTLDGGSNVLVYGPRRYGKSSMVGEVVSSLRASGAACVELSLMDIASLEDFISSYAKAVYRELAPAVGTLKHVAGLFARVKPTLALNDEGRPELTFSVASSKLGLDALRDVLELPEKLCPADRHVYVALDEFQEVSGLGLGSQFERTMRSIVEKQRHVSYIFLGSQTHLLERMFASKSRPFYNAAQKFPLQRPPQDESAAFLVSRFGSVGIALARPLAEGMVRRIDNVPYYLQALGSWTFNAVTGRNARTIAQSDIDEGMDSLYSAERILLEDTFIRYPQSQRLLLRALAREPVAVFPEAYRQRHGLASTSTVNTALRRLIAESAVARQDGVYRLADPLLAFHLSRRS